MFAIPVLNLRSDELPLRTEVCHLLGKLGIAPECMIFRYLHTLTILSVIEVLRGIKAYKSHFAYLYFEEQMQIKMFCSFYKVTYLS